MFKFFSVVGRTRCSNGHSLKVITCLKTGHPEISLNWHVLAFCWGLPAGILYACFFLRYVYYAHLVQYAQCF